MTPLPFPATLDRFPVKDLCDRYTLERTQEYKRRKFLGIQPQKEDGVSYISQDDLIRLDELDRHLKEGGTFATFGALSEPPGTDSVNPLTELGEPDSTPEFISLSPLASWLSEPGELLPLLLQVLSRVNQSLPAPQILAPQQALEEAYQHGWLLSTSQLAQILGVKSLRGQEFDRLGFRLVRCGKNGREGAWKVEKRYPGKTDQATLD